MLDARAGADLAARTGDNLIDTFTLFPLGDSLQVQAAAAPPFLAAAPPFLASSAASYAACKWNVSISEIFACSSFTFAAAASARCWDCFTTTLACDGESGFENEFENLLLLFHEPSDILGGVLMPCSLLIVSSKC